MSIIVNSLKTTFVLGRATGAIAGVLAVTVIAGCGAGPRPRVLTNAQSLIERDQTDELETVKPKLIKEAREYLRKAEMYYQRGNNEKASLYAHLATQRYQTAENFVGRTSAVQLTKVMKRGASEADDNARREEEVADELARLRKTDERIQQINIQLEADDDTPPEANGAKKNLVAARQKQSDAIGAGAPSKAPKEYDRGKALVDSALESIELGLYSESSQQSGQAIGAFDSAIRAAEKADKASAKASKTKAPVPRGPSAADIAKSAIAAAEDARVDAVRRSGPTDPALKSPDQLLAAARRAVKRRDYKRATSKAGKAEKRYEAIEGSAAVAASDSGGSDALKKLAEAKIVDLQFKRGELLGLSVNETCGGTWKEFEAILELADKRYAVGDYARAYEFAIRAAERLRKCEPGTVTASVQKKADPADDAARKKAANAVRKAQVDVASAATRDPSDESLAQARVLVKTAERWYERKDYDQADATAKSASRMALAVKKPQAVAAKKIVPKPGAGKARAAAEKAIVKAQQAQARVSAKLGEDDRLKRPDKLLKASERWLERESYDRSKQLAEQATKLYELIEKGGVATPKKTSTKKTSAKKVSCAEAGRQVRSVNRIAKRVRYGKGLDAEQKRDRTEGLGLVAVAKRRLGKRECDEASEMALEAKELLRELPRGTKPTAKKPTKVAKKTTKTTKKPTKKSSKGQPWKVAYERMMEALRARDKAAPVKTDQNAAIFTKGEGAVARARSAYDSKRYSEARREAEAAIAFFESVILAAGQQPPPRSNPDAPVASTDPADRIEAAIAKFEKSGKAADPAWKDAYRAVIAALTKRDEAKAALIEGDEAAEELIESGEEKLGQARKAYKAKKYGAVEELTDSAIKDFETVIDPDSVEIEEDDTEAPPPKSSADDGSAEFKSADAAVRSAIVMVAVCEKQQCAERDFEAFTKAKTEVDSAKTSLDAGKFGYAEELAEAAKKKLNAIFQKPRKNVEAPKEDPEKIKQQKDDADAAMREMTISYKLCQTRGCEQSDYESWLRAEQYMSASRASYADKDYVAAKSHAEKAHKSMRKILDAAPKFVIPSGVSTVTRSGDQLVLSPGIDFNLGSTTISGVSAKSVSELAQVLKANKSALSSVRLVGYTDNIGSAARNKAVSEKRAKAVLTALTNAGVPGDILAAEGRGPENPVASNRTPAGRKANRRVEVRITTK